ncbi:MAG TPA: hypothetical protein VGJ82_23385, partial [Thermoanaerobaculia bacterium]
KATLCTSMPAIARTAMMAIVMIDFFRFMVPPFMLWVTTEEGPKFLEINDLHADVMNGTLVV